LAGARNSGIEASSGKWILPLDADDKIHPIFIERTIHENDIVTTGLQTFGREIRRWKSSIIHPGYKDFLRFNDINCCSLFKREVWEQTGGYDENMRDGYEDWDFWIRATKKGFNVTRVPEILFFYRQHANSLYAHALKNHDKIIEYMIGKHPMRVKFKVDT